jgi:hypothetical protein
MRAEMISLQEELDWRCYRLYGMIDEELECGDPPPLNLGERAFEIVMARQMVAGELETTWFVRHRSTPITELPARWPNDYRALVERRLELIQNDRFIGLIERPEYKRRWSLEPWEEMEQKALRDWLLKRLEGQQYWKEVSLLSTRRLADLARVDADFMSVAALYLHRDDFDPANLIADLVESESVPYLPVLRYTESGLRKRAEWEQAWELQRQEDRTDADVAAKFNRPPNVDDVQFTRLIAEEQKRRKQQEVGDIPVPPKYRNADFQKSDFWRLRGQLDVPKERFVSYPFAERAADGSLVSSAIGEHMLGQTAPSD